MAPRTKLTESERTALAATAAQRYRDGESWAEIAQDYDLTSTYVHRLTTARHVINYRRWGQRPVADVELVCRLRDEGRTLSEIAEELGCSRQAVRTALEAAGRTEPTRYPRLSQSRSPMPPELEQTRALYEACPPAPRARPGARNVRGPEGRLLAEACRALVDEGVPMQRLSRALGVAGQDVDDDAAARAKDVQCRGSAGRVKSMACPESDTQGAFGHTVSPQTS